jgi:diguanylate cyclase (GGDEF)-like protein
VCIFQGPSARSAELVAERIRASIEKADVDAEGPAHVTISIGLAAYAADTSVEELLHRADKALYLAKREGRNRLRMAA